MAPRGRGCFRDFLFKSAQVLTCYCFFSAGPTFGPDSVDARALKLGLTCEREKEAGVGMEGGGEVRE